MHVKLHYLLFYILTVSPPLPPSMTSEWQEAQLKYNIKIRNNPVTGLASEWDYQKNDWKK